MLNFEFIQSFGSRKTESETLVTLNMTSVVIAHTNRFVARLNRYVGGFQVPYTLAFVELYNFMLLLVLLLCWCCYC